MTAVVRNDESQSAMQWTATGAAVGLAVGVLYTQGDAKTVMLCACVGAGVFIKLLGSTYPNKNSLPFSVSLLDSCVDAAIVSVGFVALAALVYIFSR